MKKLIMISVIFALVAGAAFAEATLGGQLMIGTTILQGNSEADDILMGPSQAHEAKMSATFGDSKGGGKLVFLTGGSDTAYGGANFTTNFKAWGFLYWRPVTQFRMQVGRNDDGDFGTAQISGWGFTGEAKNSVGAFSDYQFWGVGNTHYPLWPWQSALTRKGNAWFPGTGDLWNINFSIFPVDLVQINFILPIGSGLADNGDGQTQEVQSQLADFMLNAAITLEDIGKLNLSFVGKGGLGKDKEKVASVGNLYASFFLNAIDLIDMELGLNYGLPWKDAADLESDGFLGVGFGLRFDTGEAFSVKFRANARLAGKEKDADLPTLIHANILPCYKINNNLWFFFYAGLSAEMIPETPSLDAYTRIGWFINPYIWVRASEGLRFWAGLQVIQMGINDESDNQAIQWKVPFGFNFYF